MFMLLALSLLSPVSHAADEIDVSMPESFNLIQKNSSIECRISQMKNYGYVIARGEENAVRVTVINDNVSEGEKTAFDAKLMTNEFERAHMVHLRRYKNSGTYIEFVILNSVTLGDNKLLKGRMMMTSSFYSLDEFENEKEELIPELAQDMECKRL